MTGPALTLELLYEAPATPDVDALVARVRQVLPDSRLLDDEGGNLVIVHEQFDAPAPIMTAVKPSPELQVVEREHDFSQTWGWDEAQEQVARATACVAVLEVIGRRHEPSQRLTAFRAVAEALVATTGPVALWCPNIAKFVPPAHAGGLEPFINVRLFRVEGGEGEMVMDSLGLHAFGLPDVQCHFTGLDPGDMAQVLYDTAAYILERGDVIEDGNTVAGPAGEERWRCRHERSLIEPERVVVDIEPDAPYAAGRRAPERRRRWPRRRR